VESRSHQGVISQFGKYLVKGCPLDVKFADIFRKAYEVRKKSDYEPYIRPEKEAVQR
jgi:uncharacterized protein (UPF0332 family)